MRPRSVIYGSGRSGDGRSCDRLHRCCMRASQREPIFHNSSTAIHSSSLPPALHTYATLILFVQTAVRVTKASQEVKQRHDLGDITLR